MLSERCNSFEHFRGKITGKRPVFGLVVQHGVTAWAEAVALSGFDFAWIDMEHSAMHFHEVEHTIIALENYGCVPVVRVRENELNQIGQVLDMGARIVAVPHVDTVDEARRAVKAAKYYPIGRRGYGGCSRSTLQGAQRLDIELMQEQNHDTLLMVLIESEEAVRNVEEIAGVEGIDILFVGFADLCQDMGLSPDLRHPRCEEAIRKVGDALKRTGKFGALYVYDPAMVSSFREIGYTIFSCGVDTMLFKNAAEGLRKLFTD